MSLINIKIEGIPYQVEEGLTILEAAKKCGYEIPHLCYFNHGECSQGSCRVCLVEVKGARGLVASCVYPVNDGMEISISSPEALRRRIAALINGTLIWKREAFIPTPSKPSTLGWRICNRFPSRPHKPGF